MTDALEPVISSEVREIPPYHLEPVVSHIFVKDDFMGLCLEGERHYCHYVLGSSTMAVIEHGGIFYHRRAISDIALHITTGPEPAYYYPFRAVGFYSTVEKEDPAELEKFKKLYVQYWRNEVQKS